MLVVEVGAVAGRVGERAGLGDRTKPGGDPVVGAAQLEDLLDDGAVLARQRARTAVVGRRVGVLLDLDVELAVGAGVGRANQGAVLRVDGHGLPATREPHALGHGGDDPDLGERGLMPRHERDALLVSDRKR